jgi:hypothetical protein
MTNRFQFSQASQATQEARATHTLEAVAEVELGSQDLEQDHHLLLRLLHVLVQHRQDRHRRQLAPVLPCARQGPCSTSYARERPLTFCQGCQAYASWSFYYALLDLSLLLALGQSE